MNLEGTVRPVDKGLYKVVLLSLAVIVMAVGAVVFSFAYMLVGQDFSPAVYGMVIVWIGSMAFFYAVITEEHTMKELFIRHSYFFTGVLSMILGLFFVSLSGLLTPPEATDSMEFGVLLLILGAALTLLSAQRSGDYSKRSALFAMFAGLLLTIGGIMAGSMNIALGGIFIIVLGAFWMGLRTSHAQ